MNSAPQFAHPCTVLGAARMMLTHVDGTQHLKAHAALRLGYREEARRLWQGLALAGDTDALYQLARMAELGLSEPCDAELTRLLCRRAAQAACADATEKLGPSDPRCQR